MVESCTSSDSDDDIGGEFLIQANMRKRQKIQEDDNADGIESAEVVPEGRQASLEIGDIKNNVDASLEIGDIKNNVDANRKKSGRGRGSSGSGSRRGSKSNDQTRTQISSSTVSASNGQNENDGRLNYQFHNDNNASLEEENASLRTKIVVLEEDLRKAKQETSEHQNLCPHLEKELKELKDLEEQMKPKRTKVISDLLISVSKAETRIKAKSTSGD